MKAAVTIEKPCMGTTNCQPEVSAMLPGHYCSLIDVCRQLPLLKEHLSASSAGPTGSQKPTLAYAPSPYLHPTHACQADVPERCQSVLVRQTPQIHESSKNGLKATMVPT